MLLGQTFKTKSIGDGASADTALAAAAASPAASLSDSEAQEWGYVDPGAQHRYIRYRFKTAVSRILQKSAQLNS